MEALVVGLDLLEVVACAGPVWFGAGLSASKVMTVASSFQVTDFLGFAGDVPSPVSTA